MFYEALELRTLMSADPTTAVSTAVMTDRATIHADLLKFRSDGLAFAATITTDVATLEADGAVNDPTLAPLFQTLRKDAKSMRGLLRGDNLLESENVVKDEMKIIHDCHLYKSDHGDHAAQHSDRAAILDARIQLQNDEINGLSARMGTREAAYTKIFADLNAISAAVSTDTTATDQMKTDVNTFVTDATNGLNTLDKDLHKLIADRKQLVTDLTGNQSQM